MKERPEDNTTKPNDFWQQRYRQSLLPEQIETIERNLVGFFALLLELDSNEKEEIG